MLKLILGLILGLFVAVVAVSAFGAPEWAGFLTIVFVSFLFDIATDG